MIEVSHPMPSTTPSRDGWFKSSFSNNANECVEVRFDGERVSIRDSKFRRNPANQAVREPVITTTAVQWAVLLDELTGRAAAGTNGAVLVETSPQGAATLRAIDGGTTLSFTASEWRMYLAGVHAGEFQPPALAASTR